MKSLLFLSAFTASVNGLVGRAEPACCFHLNVTGEVTGPLGQLVDGQSRVDDYSLPQSQFCINSTGVMTDATGKGCIITSEFVPSKSSYFQKLIRSYHQLRLLNSNVMRVNRVLRAFPSRLLASSSSMAAHPSLLVRLARMVA